MATIRATYEELGERLHKSPNAVRLLARRRHWHVEEGNDGKARVVVEEAELPTPKRGRPHGRPHGQNANDHPNDRSNPALEAELRERAERAEQELATTRQERDAARAEVHTLRDILSQVEKRSADQLGEEHARAARAEGENVVLREALADLSGRLDRATRPWWQRMFHRP